VNLKLLELTETCENMTAAHGDLEKFRLEFRQNMESATESETPQLNTPLLTGKNPFMPSQDETSTNPIGGLSASNRMKLLNLENMTLSKRVDSLKKEVEMFRNEINLLRQSKGYDATENTRKIAVLENELSGLKKYNEDILIEVDQLRAQASNGQVNLSQKELDQ
jgi:dynactin complex subunit